jgi:hypothetical protein
MTELKTGDRQTLWVWSLLVVLGALLAVVGWWRFIN